jgi:low temperature requirement protein LtrA
MAWDTERGPLFRPVVPHQHRESGRLARLAYTYLHLPIVAGIILSAVADDIVLQHPAGHSDSRTVLSAVGGPLLFLVGTILFKHTIRGWLQLSHGVGIIALCVIGWFGHTFSPLALSVLTTALMVVVATWESISLRSGAVKSPPNGLASEKAQSEATSA